MSESDLDALIYDLLEGDTDRAHGQHILDLMTAGEARRQGSGGDPLLKAIEEAHRAKAQEADKQ